MWSVIAFVLSLWSIWCTQSLRMRVKGWMHQFPDQTTRINRINIPGTHESMATRASGTGGRFAKCLDYSIAQQLNMGYRFFDLRVKWKDNDLRIYHGKKNMRHTWHDLHLQLKAFLEPGGPGDTECVILKVKQVSGNKVTFAERFAAAIIAYNNDVAHHNDRYYFDPCGQAPQIQQCAGKAVILGDGKWERVQVWRDMNPIIWYDVNPGKGDDSMTYKPQHTDPRNPNGRFMKWSHAIDITRASPPDPTMRKFYRNGINANSLSELDVTKKGNRGKIQKWRMGGPLGDGTPLQWARHVNREVFRRIKHLSFPLADACAEQFYGSIFVDLPSHSVLLYPRKIAAIIIMSNCAIYNTVTVAKDWSNVAAVMREINTNANVEEENMMDDWDQVDDYVHRD